MDQARVARFLVKQAGYFDLIQTARADAAAGRSQNPHDPRFHLRQALIEQEAREGISFLPAMAEKRGETKPRFPEMLDNPYQQQQWVSYQKEEQALKDGLEALTQSLKEIKEQKPPRASQRIQDPDRKLSPSQLRNLGIQLRWSLADVLISEHELTAGDSATSQTAALNALKKAVNEQMEELKKVGASTGILAFLQARIAMAEANWRDASWTLEKTRGLLRSQLDSWSPNRM